MEIKEEKLFSLLDKIKKDELIEYLKMSFYEMDDVQRRGVFGEMYGDKLRKDRKPVDLYSEIENFHKKSVKGDYFAPFMINSKNFMDVPPETDEWFSEVSYYLDESSRLVEKEKYDLAINCFDLLFDLIDHMENGEDIIFADEYGTWMIVCKFSYTESYIKSLAKVKDPETYVEKVIPLLRRDSQESLSDKIYDKIKKNSTKEQLIRVEQEIKTREIRIK